jgi:hypothetical protein
MAVDQISLGKAWEKFHRFPTGFTLIYALGKGAQRGTIDAHQKLSSWFIRPAQMRSAPERCQDGIQKPIRLCWCLSHRPDRADSGVRTRAAKPDAHLPAGKTWQARVEAGAPPGRTTADSTLRWRANVLDKSAPRDATPVDAISSTLHPEAGNRTRLTTQCIHLSPATPEPSKTNAIRKALAFVQVSTADNTHRLISSASLRFAAGAARRNRGLPCRKSSAC